MGSRWLFGLAALASASIFAAPLAAQEVAGVEHWVERKDARIYVWEKYVETPAARKVIVLAHGSATAGKESFDLQVPGKPSYSFMDALAREGFDVFALDTRGFGRSTHPDAHMTTLQASEDLNAVVDYVLSLRNVRTVGLLGWSWGTQYGGMFVMAHPEKVERYVAYAQMHIDSPDLAKRRPLVETYRRSAYVSIPEANWKPRFFSMTPAGVNEPEVVDAFARAAVQAEPKTALGPQLDLTTTMPMVHPKLIPVPVLMIHGQYDDVADPDGLFPFFRQLPNPYKRYTVVPDAGHMAHLQKGHRLLQHEVVQFFKAPHAGDAAKP